MTLKCISSLSSNIKFHHSGSVLSSQRVLSCCVGLTSSATLMIVLIVVVTLVPALGGSSCYYVMSVQRLTSLPVMSSASVAPSSSGDITAACAFRKSGLVLLLALPLGVCLIGLGCSGGFAGDSGVAVASCKPDLALLPLGICPARIDCMHSCIEYTVAQTDQVQVPVVMCCFLGFWWGQVGRGTSVLANAFLALAPQRTPLGCN